MKTTWTILSVALAVSFLAVEAQAAGFARNSHSTGSVGKTNFSTGNNFHQGNLNSSTLKSSSQLLVKHNGTTSPTKLGPLNTANNFNTVASKNHVGNLNLKTVAAKNLAVKLNLNQETTTGIKDPRTGQDLSKNANPGYGLPGGKDISKEFPSAEQQWNDRLKGTLAGGSDYIGNGTPFDDKPGSDPMGDFLGQHGGNLPDPLAGYGQGRSGFSPADADPAQAPVQDPPGQDHPGGPSATGGEVTLGSSYIICASDFVSPKDSGAKKDECIEVQYDRDDGFKTEADRKMLVDFWLKWVPKGNNDQQYEGEGGYTGGGGHSANDLYIGSNGRMTGKVVGGYDPGEAGVGKDTGGRLPAQFEAIGKYVSRGGKVHGKAGFQSGDSDLGQDIGGAAENNISGLKKAIDAQRFIIDPNAPNSEEIPWWLRDRVSPMDKASTAQVNAMQVDLQQGVAAHQNEAAK
jgi:hypothetical protein